MSDASAIAAVSAVLKSTLDNGLKAARIADMVGGDVTVSALPPDRVNPGAEDPTQLNVFLHQTTPNSGWRNVDLPSRNANGERTANPPLALDLHYLLTAYGAKSFFAEIVLGHAMQLLHETPILTRDAIDRALSSQTAADFPKALATCGLASQLEQIRITPETLNTDELSKLWTAMQARLRPSAAYRVTVVLIESTRSTKGALPVASRNLYVLPFRHPVITRIASDVADTAPIAAGSPMRFEGERLRGAVTKILIGGADVAAAATAVNDTSIRFQLPDQLPAGVYAGIQSARVVHLLPMGSPPTDHRAVESNVEAFTLRPTIVPHIDAEPASTTVDGVTTKTGRIVVDCNPKVAEPQRVVLFLNELDAPAARAPRAYSFHAPTGNGVADATGETAKVTIPFERVEPGTYLVRVQVDGAESPLSADATGKYVGPKLTI